MQLPPLSSSSYTVIPEKSFHLCQTCTLSSACTHTKGHIPLHINTHSHLNKHTHTHSRHFLFSSILGILSAAAPVSTPRKHNTILKRPNLLFNSAYSAKPLCFCTNHLLIVAQSPPHHGSFKPTCLIQNP